MVFGICYGIFLSYIVDKFCTLYYHVLRQYVFHLISVNKIKNLSHESLKCDCLTPVMKVIDDTCNIASYKGNRLKPEYQNTLIVKFN